MVFKAISTPWFPLHLRLIVLCCSLTGQFHCITSAKNPCQVFNGAAYCSHQSLSEIPADLPWNITSLDMSHNRLVKISYLWLTPYPDLLSLNVSFNSISSLHSGLCQTLPLLQTLNIEHNQLYELKTEALSHCTSLIWLNMANNKLKLQGEPFSALQNLKYLEVAKNKFKYAALSSQPQLPSLKYLGLAGNDFNTLKSDDFSFLNHSSLQVLNLSSVSLQTLESGCFKPISSLRTLFLDGSKMGTPVISKLCAELSGTEINYLSLKRTELVSLTTTVFTGLQKTNLSILDLTWNNMEKIEEGSFQWLAKLQALSLAENNIKHLHKDTFQGLKSLKTLNLTRALTKSKTHSGPVIDNFAFQPLGSLESLTLRESAVGEIGAHMFTGLTSLRELDMSWSKYGSPRTITEETFVSLGGSPLTKLNLRGTAIKQIGPGTFSALRNLTILHLDHNFINQTLSGQEFTNLFQVQELYMSRNQKLSLHFDSFANVPNLRVLTLGKSLTGTHVDLDPSPFKPLSKLKILDLSNNNIANVREDMLDGLLDLDVLLIQHNNLARLWKSANLGGPVLFLKGVPNLVTLVMDSNGFDEIPLEAFKGLNHLQTLSLSNNLLDSLKDSVFEDLLSLQVLQLQKNLITAVRPQVFRTPMSHLSELFMNKNPFDCTCDSILWFVTWLNTTNTSVSDIRDQYICNTPLLYFNHSIMDFDTQSCKDMTPFQALYILSSTAVLMLMVTALLVRFHGWRIHFYWNILINRTLGFSDATADEDRGYEYDAYIIHSEEDADWVERRMIPLENERCRFCLEDRDSIPGMSQLESIVDNLRKSKKILFVVTESLLRDPWCRRFKAHHALHQVIEASRDCVVLVFLEDVHDYKLSHSLFLRRGMLRSSCILDWPVHKERIPAFHQKLLIALGMTNQLQQ
uniref:Toll-like receptor 3 n=1 Tax=Sphaeramia orbicularis TaxID=375764 RepID=A0A672YLL2_9TELE